ncbi:MAG TPA: A/G-specific adenine glycosylase [Candidatus Limnocylindria bacterium]|nr:A/G-specific adenine glycosylase [Candidatus Limnocylindria bacterium]
MTGGARRRGPDARTLRMLRRRILGWYAATAREVPWRRTSDPWAVLVSEVMLQQTQASRVADRFPPFLERFPTPGAMAAASTADVLAAWSGLGYNRRAVALHRAATRIEAQGWPATLDGLETLPGVGRYTARAVAALAFGRPVGAVDTNVRRWLVRRFGLHPSPAGGRLQALADALAGADPRASTSDAAAWMHASMEFGALVCRARQPACSSCPVRVGCPSRDAAPHVPVTRQPGLPGSERLLRGRLLRELSDAGGYAIPLARARSLAGSHDLVAVLDRLEREGLAHRRGAWLRLGGPATSTIKP